ncbi:hypothetical protein [Nitrobacter sp. JJSN]|uniref:hypothetical protein n=1 Tax=Nitrobacter sp. JJSN TaxID=3453033 RepID=UPI003F75FDFB
MRVQTFGTWTGAISGIGAGALTASPDYQFLAPYLALASAAVWAMLLLWFLIANRREIQLGVSKLGSWYFIVPCLALAILAIAGAAYGLGLRSALSRSTPEKTKEVVATHIDLGSVGTENKSILVVNRKNKEEVAGRLDAIASEINSHGDEILKNAEVAINRSSSLLKKPKLTASMILGTPHRDDVYSAARCSRCRPGDDAVMP